MSPRVDFEWREGEQIFPVPPDPPPAPPTAPQTAAPPDTHPAFPGNLTLLIIGLVLGVGVGFLLLGAQGQGNARRDLTPLFELQQRALAQGDAELFARLLDDSDAAWRDQHVAALAPLAQLYDLDAPPRVRRVHLEGQQAEVEIAYRYQGQRYRQLQWTRQTANGWQLSGASLGDWGEIEHFSGEAVQLHVRSRDAFLAADLARIDAVVAEFCRRYAPPPPCRIDLHILPDPDLLPFRPGQGAAPNPPFTRYRIMGQGSDAGDTPYVTLNGAGNETHDPLFQQNLLLTLAEVNDIHRVYAAHAATPEAQRISAQRLQGESIPVFLPSPRLVGLHGQTPHPLWQLALVEAIGDAILRRSVGPITAEEEAALTLWAAARGDVALWAERFSGVRLPALAAISPDPAAAGKALLFHDPEQRAAARSFALFLHAAFGEEQTLALLRQARQQMSTPALFAPLASEPQQLATAWAAWLAQHPPPPPPATN